MLCEAPPWGRATLLSRAQTSRQSGSLGPRPEAAPSGWRMQPLRLWKRARPSWRRPVPARGWSVLPPGWAIAGPLLVCGGGFRDSSLSVRPQTSPPHACLPLNCRSGHLFTTRAPCGVSGVQLAVSRLLCSGALARLSDLLKTHQSISTAHALAYSGISSSITDTGRIKD